MRQNDAENKKYVGTTRKCPKTHILHSNDTSTELKIKKAVPVVKHANGSEKEKTKIPKASLSSSGIRKKTDNKKKICKSAISEVIYACGIYVSQYER